MTKLDSLTAKARTLQHMMVISKLQTKIGQLRPPKSAIGL
jgi:hypothetical protein